MFHFDSEGSFPEFAAAHQTPSDHAEEEVSPQSRLKVTGPYFGQAEPGDHVGHDHQFNAAVQEKYCAAEKLQNGS